MRSAAPIAAVVRMITLPLALAGCPRERALRPKTAFSGDSALAYVRAQLAFGPRIPGSVGHRRTGDWIVSLMRARADTEIEQRWVHVTQKGDSLPLRNILARFRPTASDRVLYVTHWDTRPVSDLASDPAQRSLPVPGANDGASGVALFIALADVLKRTPPNVGVDLLFVDGEDYGPSFDPPYHDVLLGSEYFATHLPEAGYKPIYAVLWDMIGDRQLDIYQEVNSLQQAPEVVSLVWRKAAELGYANFFISSPGDQITDDHVPLLKAGIRCIDVIDIDYPPHHTPDDTIDKLSARSLQIVGDVATSLVTGETS